MSASDYYGGGGGGSQQQQSHYGSGTGSNYPAGGDNNQPFSPPPTIYTPASSTQHSPYPGSAQPSYDQQNANAGYGGGGHSPRPDYSYAGSPCPTQQEYARPHTPYQQQQGQSQGQGQGYGYGGYQSNYDQGQSYNASNDYAARFGGNSPQPAHATPAYGGGPPPYNQQDNHYNNNQQPPPGQYAQPGDPANPGDKGILGAFGGAAVGGYAGHQVNHGFLGAVGGAITGSVAEDAWKKKNKKDKKDKKDKKNKNKWGAAGGRRDSSSSSSSSSSSDDDKKKKKKHGAAATGALRGNFSASSRGVELHGTELVAWCNPVRGGPRRSAVNLNSVLSNQRGNFVWARGGNFGASARNVRLVEGGRVLEAELGNGMGGWNRGWVRLDERITNDDGNLRFLD